MRWLVAPACFAGVVCCDGDVTVPLMRQAGRRLGSLASEARGVWSSSRTTPELRRVSALVSREPGGRLPVAPVRELAQPIEQGADLGLTDRDPDGATESGAGAAPALLWSIGRETSIFQRPDTRSPRIGYLRFGAAVRRTGASTVGKGCSGDWYRIVPDGYVCVNERFATIDPRHHLLRVSMPGPNRDAPFPYVYGLSRGMPLPLLAALPASSASQHNKGATNAKIRAQAWGLDIATDDQDWLTTPVQAVGLAAAAADGAPRHAVPRSGFSLVGLVEAGSQLFAMTPERWLVPEGVLKPVKPSEFHGLSLESERTLPVGFTSVSGAVSMALDPRTRQLTLRRRLPRRTALALSGRRARMAGAEWAETLDGDWVKASQLRVVNPRTSWPDFAQNGEGWLDVSIRDQTLVAYQGTRPVYVTLVSTGVQGPEPESPTATKLGTFRIQTKHVTATMDSDDPEEAYDLRDVPWVQYFSQGYALHAVFWHDGFGAPRSHGCINLSPIDARWLFHWTSPGVPRDWHGAMDDKGGSIVYVHE